MSYAQHERKSRNALHMAYRNFQDNVGAWKTMTSAMYYYQQMEQVSESLWTDRKEEEMTKMLDEFLELIL